MLRFKRNCICIQYIYLQRLVLISSCIGAPLFVLRVQGLKAGLSRCHWVEILPAILPEFQCFWCKVYIRSRRIPIINSHIAAVAAWDQDFGEVRKHASSRSKHKQSFVNTTPQPYTPKPQTRTKQGLIKASPELVWGLLGGFKRPLIGLGGG